MISILILTLNEENNIRQCLESVSWSNDVVVVDSFSIDRTVEVARSNGARVFQSTFVNFAQQRNFGLSHGSLKNEWVLHLDADELVTSQLRDELLKAVRQTQYQAYRIASKLIFQGRWLRHSGMYPSYQVRFGRRDALDFQQVGHGQRENLGATLIGTLEAPLLHYGFSKGLEEWFAKHNRYSSAEAAENAQVLDSRTISWGALLGGNAMSRRRALKNLSIHLPFRPAFRFVYMYFLRLGFLEGRAGWRYCCLLSIYESMIVLKVRELQLKRGQMH